MKAFIFCLYLYLGFYHLADALPLSNTTSPLIPKDYLVVIAVNGLFGSASDWDMMKREMETTFNSTYPDHELAFFASRKNMGLKTAQSIAVMGKRLSEEIRTEFMPSLRKRIQSQHHRARVHFTILAHSMGGLISRQALASMCQDASCSALIPPNTDPELLRIRPCSFITVGTPHLGARYTGDDVKDKLRLAALENMIGQAGKELGLYDGSDESRGLLVSISDYNSVYVQSLLRFPYKTLVGHVRDDLVPLPSAMIGDYCASVKKDELSDVVFDILGHTAFDESPLYEQRLFSHYSNRMLLPTDKNAPMGHGKCEQNHDGLAQIEYNSDMTAQLQRIPWRRVVVDFNSDHFITSQSAHVILIGKRVPSFGNGQKNAEESVKMISQILSTDFELSMRGTILSHSTLTAFSI